MDRRSEGGMVDRSTRFIELMTKSIEVAVVFRRLTRGEQVRIVW